MQQETAREESNGDPVRSVQRVARWDCGRLPRRGTTCTEPTNGETRLAGVPRGSS